MILFVLIICVSTDIGGYVFGKIFKGPKLTKISPNKTFSGMMGGLLLSVISIYLYTLVAYVIITLLVQFEIVNRYNRIIDLILRGLIALHEPLLIKIRKYIPFIGGMDFSPVIVILLLSFIRNLLIDYRLSL